MPNSIRLTGSHVNVISGPTPTTSSQLTQHTHSCVNVTETTPSSNAPVITLNYEIKKDDNGKEVGLLLGSFTTTNTVYPEKEDIIALAKVIFYTTRFPVNAWAPVLIYAAEKDFDPNALFAPIINGKRGQLYAKKIDELSSVVSYLIKRISENKDGAKQSSRIQKLNRFLDEVSKLIKNRGFMRCLLFRKAPLPLVLLSEESLKKAEKTFSLITELKASVDCIHCSYKLNAELKNTLILAVIDYFKKHDKDISACFHFTETSKQQREEKSLIHFSIRSESARPLDIKPLPPFTICLNTAIQILTHLEQLQRQFCPGSDAGILLGIENLTLSSFCYEKNSDRIHLTLAGMLALLVATKAPDLHLTSVQQCELTTKRNQALYAIIDELLEHTPEWKEITKSQKFIARRDFTLGLNKKIRYFHRELIKIQSAMS